jgi:leader peptidase (prepilin peptidase) / N-methyltransferase
MIRILGTVLAGLLGLAFGSFLNVCLSRWPEGESAVKPRSHCRSCGRELTWWENVPLVSWIALRGRCRTCKAKISWRYPLVELAIGVLWAIPVWQLLTNPEWSAPAIFIYVALGDAVGKWFFYWLLVALALLDAKNLWLPDWLTLPGTALGFIVAIVTANLDLGRRASATALHSLIGILAAAGLILLIRWAYWLVRRREGIGLGDAKLMAMLAAWLGLPGALLSFGLGVFLGAGFALVLLFKNNANKASAKHTEGAWAITKLPLGTFLCIGGIVSGLWGRPIIEAYLRWAGF